MSDGNQDFPVIPNFLFAAAVAGEVILSVTFCFVNGYLFICLSVKVHRWDFAYRQPIAYRTGMILRGEQRSEMDETFV